MLNSTILYNNIITYKNNNINNPDYTGYEIYKNLIPEYIFNNVYIEGTYINTQSVVIPNYPATKLAVTDLVLDRYYSNRETFLLDFENKILSSILFTTPVGMFPLSWIISGKLSNELDERMKNLSEYSYENIVLNYTDIIVQNVKTNSWISQQNVLGSFVTTTIS